MSKSAPRGNSGRKIANPIVQTYGNRLRVRVCGLLVESDKILLVNHGGLGPGDFWSPPGGGLNFGEDAKAGLKREMKEETGIEIEVDEFLFVCEFLHEPLHAVELFFKVHRTGGDLKTGTDPEMKSQIIRTVRFLDWKEVAALHPGNLHGSFGLAVTPSKIMNLNGYFKL
jgi:8-oxo-dGTP diphosphatase